MPIRAEQLEVSEAHSSDRQRGEAHSPLGVCHRISVAERQLVIAVRRNRYERLIIHLLSDGPKLDLVLLR
jgi:hypothetical protein